MEKMRDLDLIDQSIQKWQCIVYHGNQNLGPNDCPLCKKYHANYCKSCPIEGYTNKNGCDGTPYNNFFQLQYNLCIIDQDIIETLFLFAANRMLSFLYEMRLWYINQINQRK